MKIVLTIVLICQLSCSLAQDYKDSECRALNTKAMRLYQAQPEAARKLLETAMGQARKAEDPELLALTQNNLAILQRMEGHFPESKALSAQSLPLAREPLTKASIYNNLGACNRSLGAYKEALTNYIAALRIYERANDPKRQATVNNNIGMVFSAMEQFDKAKTYHRKALDIFAEIKDAKGLSESFNNLAIAIATEGDLEGAMVYFRKSLRIEQSLKDKKGIAESLNNVGEVHYYLQNIDSALYYYKASAGYEKQINNFSGVAESYNNMGQIYIERKQFPAARQYLDSAQLFSKKSKEVQVLLESLDNDRLYYEALGNWPRANEKMKAYYELKDSIRKASNSKEVNELETKYQTAKKEKLILEEQAENKRKTTWLYGLGIVALFTACVGYLIYRQQKLQNKQQQQEFQLQSAIAQIETQNKLQEQRLAISRDLHDNIGAQLTFVISSVDNLKFGNKITDSKVTGQLTKISDFTKSTIVELRDTIWAMNTHEFTFEDFRSRIYNFIEKAKSAKEDVRFVFQVDESLQDQKFSSIVGINLYRTMQEAVNNAVKYAQATEISVTVSAVDGKISIRIQDDGQGFDTSLTEPGNGLHNMKKRMEEIGGTWQLTSAPGQGTTIQLLILKNQQA